MKRNHNSSIYRRIKEQAKKHNIIFTVGKYTPLNFSPF